VSFRSHCEAEAKREAKDAREGARVRERLQERGDSDLHILAEDGHGEHLGQSTQPSEGDAARGRLQQ